MNKLGRSDQSVISLFIGRIWDCSPCSNVGKGIDLGWEESNAIVISWCWALYHGPPAVCQVGGIMTYSLQRPCENKRPVGSRCKSITANTYLHSTLVMGHDQLVVGKEVF